MHRTIVKLVAVAALLAVAVAPAAAKKGSKPAKPAVTKITFKLDQQELNAGDEATGSVLVRTRSHRSWVALPDATLEVTLDGLGVGTVVTDGDGRAEVAVPGGDPGEHTLKVRYAGDGTHKKAQRAQGFEVSEPAPDEELVEE